MAKIKLPEKPRGMLLFWIQLSPGQTIATCQRNISQHCWVQHIACVWPPCCDVLRHVVCCWLKFATFSATYPNIVGRNMLRAFGHPVATCCMLLAQVWSWSNLSQQHPTPRNMSRHGGQTHAICCTQQYCDILRRHVVIVSPGHYKFMANLTLLFCMGRRYFLVILNRLMGMCHWMGSNF